MLNGCVFLLPGAWLLDPFPLGACSVFQVQLAPLVGAPPPGDGIVAFRRFVTMEVGMGLCGL